MTGPRRNRRAIVVGEIELRPRETNVVADPRDLDEALRILARMLVRRARKEGRILGEIRLEESPTVSRLSARPKTADPNRN